MGESTANLASHQWQQHLPTKGMHDKLSVGDVSDIGYFDVHFKMSNLYAFYSHRVGSTGNIILQSDTDMRDVFFYIGDIWQRNHQFLSNYRN